MQKTTQCSLADLLDVYRGYLLSKVSKVRILGEADERELKDVFVELSVVERRTLQQQAEFLGMMDSAMRQRFNPFQTGIADTTLELPEEYEEETDRRVKPNELLRRRTKAIVTSAPGCGKTTLLKYLALQAQEKEKRLAMWIELKAIDKPLFVQAEKAAAHDGSLILPELWLRHLKAQLSLNHAEIKLLREYWQEKFKENEIAVLLDGFDELQDEAIERSLNRNRRVIGKIWTLGKLTLPIRNLFASMNRCRILICCLELSISEILWFQRRVSYGNNHIR